MSVTKKPIAGNRIVHLYRLLSKAQSEDAKKMFYPTQDDEEISNDVETTKTKDGSEATPAGAEVSLSSTNIFGTGDTTAKDMREACRRGLEVEAWRVNLDEPGTTEGTFAGTYYRGYVTSFSSSAPAEGMVEVSTEFTARGTGVDGFVTLSDEQVADAVYTFEDVKKKGA